MRAANAALIGPVASPRTEVGALVISTANDTQFCMDHRLEVDHKCSKVYENHIEDSMPKTKALVASILASKPKRDPKVVKDQKMAAKVQLMKLKMKAQGSKAIMSSERIYFGIKSPTKEDLTPVFVCSKWPFGRVLDFVIDTIGNV